MMIKIGGEYFSKKSQIYRFATLRRSIRLRNFGSESFYDQQRKQNILDVYFAYYSDQEFKNKS